MNALDLFIALFVLLFVWRGARTGFLAAALSLTGVILGAALGSRIVPALLGGREDLAFGSVTSLASIVAFAVLGDVLARSLGRSLQKRLATPTSEALNRAGGAILAAALSLTLVWMAATFALGTLPLSPLYPAIQQSAILRALNEGLPSQLLTHAVSQLDPLPKFQGPEADVADPSSEIAGNSEVRAATSSVVRIRGVACGYGVEGSGWVAAPGLVVTNAHVIAGEDTTLVQPEGKGLPLNAKAVVFDEKNDIAALRVEDLNVPPLPLADPNNGEQVAIMGFPENGPFDVRAGRLGNTLRIISSDAYNRGPVERTVTSFKGFVRPGNSGGPAVNADGAVVATVFASRADSADVGYGVPSSILQQLIDLAKTRDEPVSTSECAG